MKQSYNFIKIFLLVNFIVSCNEKESDIINFYAENNIIDFNEIVIENSISVTFNTPLVIPIQILTGDSTLILYDYADGGLKQFFLDSSEKSFYPIQDGPNRIEGEFFKGVGLFDSINDSLLVGTNRAIVPFNTNDQKFSSNVVDRFPHCVSFNSSFYEIFFQKIGDDTIIISQNGNPCYDLGDLSKSVTLENFKDKYFVRIASANREESLYTLKLPDFPMKHLYERFRFTLTYNEESEKFYAMLNPLTYLFEYKINEDNLEFELTNYWDLELKNSNQPVDYFIEEFVNQEVTTKSLDYNFELNFLDSYERFVFISYRPSIDLIFDNPSDAPYSSHYLLAILDLEEGNIQTFSLDYDKFQFYGISSGRLWIYDVVSSENSGATIFSLLEIRKLLNKNE